MYFDYKDNLLVCTIDKVMSTTLLAHFKNLALKRERDFINMSTASRDEIRDVVYALKRGKIQRCIQNNVIDGFDCIFRACTVSLRGFRSAGDSSFCQTSISSTGVSLQRQNC